MREKILTEVLNGPLIRFSEKETPNISHKNIKRLSDKAYSHILMGIYRRHYPRGSRITEAEIAKELKMSNGPVREAIKKLHQEGWVQTTTNVGTFVTNYFDSETLLMLFRARVSIETGVFQQLAEIASYQQIGRLEQILERLEDALVNKNTSAYNEADLDFHKTAIYFIGQERLVDFWMHMILQIFFAQKIPSEAEDYLQHTVDICLPEASHRKIFEAITEHDAHKVYGIVKKHLDFSKTNLAT